MEKTLELSRQTPGFEWLEYLVWSSEYPPIHPFRSIKFVYPKESWVLPADFMICVLIFAILCSIFRYICFETVFSISAERIGIEQHQWGRYFESLWQFLFYLPMSILEAVALLDKPYFYETWKVWEEPYPHQEVEELTWWVFMIQLGWYTHCLYSTLFLDQMKSDFLVLILHHAVTLPLIYFCLAIGNQRVGLIILFSHDVCDIFLHMCKILRYIDKVSPFREWVRLLCFLTVPVSWILFRLILFPWKGIYPSFVLAPFYGGWLNASMWIPFNLGLLVLWFLQIYWFILIAKIIVVKLQHGNYDDVREQGGNGDSKLLRSRKQKNK